MFVEVISPMEGAEKGTSNEDEKDANACPDVRQETLKRSLRRHNGLASGGAEDVSAAVEDGTLLDDLSPGLGGGSSPKAVDGEQGFSFVKGKRTPSKGKKRKTLKPRSAEYPCNISGCGLTFLKDSDLYAHSVTHNEVKPYICHYGSCTKSFTERNKLRRHFLTHTGERPFACTFNGCGKTFSLDFNLRSHMKTHTGEYATCHYPNCEKKYTHQYKLRVHIQKDHEGGEDGEVSRKGLGGEKPKAPSSEPGKSQGKKQRAANKQQSPAQPRSPAQQAQQQVAQLPKLSPGGLGQQGKALFPPLMEPPSLLQLSPEGSFIPNWNVPVKAEKISPKPVKSPSSKRGVSSDMAARSPTPTRQSKRQKLAPRHGGCPAKSVKGPGEVWATSGIDSERSGSAEGEQGLGREGDEEGGGERSKGVEKGGERGRVGAPAGQVSCGDRLRGIELRRLKLEEEKERASQRLEDIKRAWEEKRKEVEGIERELSKLERKRQRLAAESWGRGAHGEEGEGEGGTGEEEDGEEEDEVEEDEEGGEGEGAEWVGSGGSSQLRIVPDIMMHGDGGGNLLHGGCLRDQVCPYPPRHADAMRSTSGGSSAFPQEETDVLLYMSEGSDRKEHDLRYLIWPMEKLHGMPGGELDDMPGGGSVREGRPVATEEDGGVGGEGGGGGENGFWKGPGKDECVVGGDDDGIYREKSGAVRDGYMFEPEGDKSFLLGGFLADHLMESSVKLEHGWGLGSSATSGLANMAW